MSVTIYNPETISTFFYQADGIDSIRALTDQLGTITNDYDYTAFGEPHRISIDESNGVDQRYSYTGRESSLLADVGAPMYYRYRSYDSDLGRFMRKDPIGYDVNPWANLYKYVDNSPMAFTDPFGTVSCPTDKNRLGYSWEEISRPDLPFPSTETGIIKRGHCAGSSKAWRQERIRYVLEKSKLGRLRGNCGIKTTFSSGIIHSDDASWSIQAKLEGGASTGTAGATASVSGGYSYKKSTGQIGAVTMEFGPDPCYEYVGIPVIKIAYVDYRCKRWGGRRGFENKRWNEGWKKIYIEAGILVCRRKCKESCK